MMMITKKELSQTIYKSIEESLSKLETAPVTTKKVSKLLKKASKKIAKQINAKSKKQNIKSIVAKKVKKIKKPEESVSL